MKIVGRTLVILSAALVVGGITFAIGLSSAGTNTNAAGPGGQLAQRRPPGAGESDFREGRSPEGAGASWVFSLFQVVQNFVIVGVIVTIGALALNWLRRRSRPARQRIPPEVVPRR